MPKPKHAFWIVVTCYLGAIFVLTHNDPFFGDSISSISRAANLIYDSNFADIHYPENLDPGHPITFPLIHAVGWELLGKNLWVSHLIQLGFSFLIILVLTRWAKKEGHERGGYLAALLLMATPLFVSQSVNPNMHLPLTAFALGLAYSLRHNRTLGQVLFSCGLVIFHLQGLYYLAPIWMWWFFGQSKLTTDKRFTHAIKILVLPALLLVGWMFYHHAVTGWYLSSPDYADHRGFPGFKRMIVNLILAEWRMADYGQIALFILPFLALVRSRFSVKKHPAIGLFLIIYTFNVIALAITTKTGPMHRYLLPCLPFIVLANAPLLQQRIGKTSSLVFAVLLSGHFWFYPGKVMGDATMAYRSVFPLLEEAKEDFNQASFYTYAPLSNPSKDTRLCCSDNDYVPLYDVNMDHVPFVLYSNISGDFKTSELKKLMTWPCYTYERGYVFVQIFSNPNLVENPKENTPREIGWFEQFILKWKNKIKGEDSV